jgi:glutathione S-transferase
MTLTVYLHPLSSYSQKAITAFYEKEVPFTVKMLDNSEPVASEFAALWPVKKFPVAVDEDRFIFEATGIIEYLEARYPGAARLIPQDPLEAAEVRMWDRFFDNYIAAPQQQIVYAVMKGGSADSEACVPWRRELETAYGVLEKRMAGREWAAGESFSLADCAAAPMLLYADWTHPIDPAFTEVRAYRTRLLARPSYARALDEARPYRHLFPLGAPEGRD